VSREKRAVEDETVRLDYTLSEAGRDVGGETVVAELPAESYQNFLKELAKLGKVETSPPAPLRDKVEQPARPPSAELQKETAERKQKAEEISVPPAERGEQIAAGPAKVQSEAKPELVAAKGSVTVRVAIRIRAASAADAAVETKKAP
jgi:hypothetical protein